MKKKDGEKSKLKPEETVDERVKLRKQKAGHEYLSNMSFLEGDEDFPPIPSLEGDEEEVKEAKGLKLIVSYIPNKSLTILLIILAQIKLETIYAKYKIK